MAENSIQPPLDVLLRYKTKMKLKILTYQVCIFTNVINVSMTASIGHKCMISGLYIHLGLPGTAHNVHSMTLGGSDKHNMPVVSIIQIDPISGSDF